MQLPDELSFLEEVLNDTGDKFRQAAWLESDFQDNIWKYNFNYKTGSKKLDWNIPLYNGSYLTHPENDLLLTSLKHWLVASTDKTLHSKSQVSNGEAAMSTQNRNFRHVLRLIDFFLVNAEHYRMVEFGFGGVTGDDLKHALDLVYKNSQTAESLFSWTSTVKKFLKELIDNTDNSLIESVLIKHKELNVVDEDLLSECKLGLTENEIIQARAVLVINDLMRDKRSGSKTKGIPKKGMYGLNTKKLSSILYKNCLYVKNEAKPALPIFDITINAVHFRREMPSVNVRTKEDELLSHSNYLEYVRGISTLSCLNILELPSPSPDELHSALNHVPEVRTEPGRFTTIPYDIVFKAIKDAIEFHLKYGDKLVDSYCNLMVLSVNEGKKVTSLTKEEFLSALEPEILELGVSDYGLSCAVTGNKHESQRKRELNTYYQELRKNKGFLELLLIYYGATKLVTGALTARRDGELKGLNAGSCLDDTESWLVFEVRKSTKNLFGLRQTTARPIDPMPIEMLKNLIKIQTHMIEYGYLNDYEAIFAHPSLKGAISLSKGERIEDYPVNLSCDYFQVATNSKGERYYFRQHQLRRFFAMLFFHSSTFGGLETLQWMLGHTDPEHVWHYITESTTGDVIRGAKAQYVAESLHYGSKDYSELAEFVVDRFNTNEFSVIDVQELEDFVDFLLREKKITLEPEFFTDSNKRKMRVVLKITERQSCAENH
ncbi:site-specific integrase [Vibrio parahaemolyticus]|nr:site-specific integrase [Vibrio parahaemolyticus]MCR9655999.1 site-specific integrase [Vibrio parahaemolyticus]